MVSNARIRVRRTQNPSPQPISHDSLKKTNQGNVQLTSTSYLKEQCRLDLFGSCTILTTFPWKYKVFMTTLDISNMNRCRANDFLLVKNDCWVVSNDVHFTQSVSSRSKWTLICLVAIRRASIVMLDQWESVTAYFSSERSLLSSSKTTAPFLHHHHSITSVWW